MHKSQNVQDLEMLALASSMEIHADPQLMADFQATIDQIPHPSDFDWASAFAQPCTSYSAPTPSGSKHTTIRIPRDVVESFNKEAARTGTKPQTLMISALRTAATVF